MERYVGMDVSLKETSICVVDGNGRIVCEGTVISEPSAIAEFIKAKAAGARRIGLETGPTTTWLWHELRSLAAGPSSSSAALPFGALPDHSSLLGRPVEQGRGGGARLP